MPSYHIWIRKEDEAKWKAIENKPEWLRVHLNADPILITKPKLQVKRLVDESTLYVKTKCDICGNYHFSGDLQAIKQWHVPDLYPELNQTPKTGVLTSAYLEEQFDKAGGKEVITEIAVSDIDVAQEVLNALNEPTITEPEDVA